MTLNRKTPMNRGTSQLKRTPLARTGMIRARVVRQIDTPESLAVRRAYRKANPECEVSKWLRTQPHLIHLIQVQWGKPELDHLWGGSSGRLDLLGMLLIVDAWWHRWKTSHPIEGLVLFLVVKHSKGEINAAEFRQCSGMDLLGWLTLDKTIAACPTWLDSFRLELVKRLEAT